MIGRGGIRPFHDVLAKTGFWRVPTLTAAIPWVGAPHPQGAVVGPRDEDLGVDGVPGDAIDGA